MEKENIWQLENTHLQTVYKELQEENERAEGILQTHRKEGLQQMREIDGGLSLDMSNYSDQVDSFAQIEMRNREIDQLNVKYDHWQRKLEQTTRLLQSPYFARIDVTYEGEETQERYYLGVHSFINQEEEHRIIDWRTPVAELYYNQELGRTSYTVEDKEILVNLNLRRQFKIKQNTLVHLFDSRVAIEDRLLLSALEQNSSPYMQDITATIQKEQNAIIRDTTSRALLVNGVAGSGKTSAVLQRIAYLMYQERSTLKSTDVVLMSPNVVFMHYISQVLPNLGEKNPTNHTLTTLLEKDLLTSDIVLEGEEWTNKSKMRETETKEEKVLRSVAFFEFLGTQASKSPFEASFFTDIKRGEKLVLPKEKIYEWYQKTPKEADVRARVRAVAEFMQKYIQNGLMKRAKTKEFHEKIMQFTETQQKKYFGALIEDESKQNLTRLSEKFLKIYYKSILRQIKQGQFVDVAQILMKRYEEFSEKTLNLQADAVSQEVACALVYLTHLYKETLEERQVKYVLVDEAQDYSPFAMKWLLVKFPRAKWTLLGDENQAIFQTHLSFSQMKEFFVEAGRNVTEKHLLTSYRSNGPITRLFQTLANEKEYFDIKPIRDSGDVPEMMVVKRLEEMITPLKKLLGTFSNEESIALVVKDFDSLRQYQELLGQEVPLQCFDVQTKKVPGKGVNLLAIPLAKGLEFDHVIVLDASNENYRTDRDRRLLYTAISRGMKSVSVMACGTLSMLLQK